jgi:hypothetical protein
MQNTILTTTTRWLRIHNEMNTKRKEDRSHSWVYHEIHPKQLQQNGNKCTLDVVCKNTVYLTTTTTEWLRIYTKMDEERFRI